MESINQPDAKRFSHQEHDVTCCCEVVCCGGSRLILGEEEAELRKHTCCGICTSAKRGPYGELGTVDTITTCCFHGFRAASLMTSGGDGEAVQCTGCGCEGDKVAAIVEELKKRQELRGDRAKVRLAESTLTEIQNLHKKMDLILDHLKLSDDPVYEQPMERGGAKMMQIDC